MPRSAASLGRPSQIYSEALPDMGTGKQDLGIKSHEEEGPSMSIATRLALMRAAGWRLDRTKQP